VRPHDLAQPTGHAVAHHGVADLLGHDESHAGCPCSLRELGEMHHHVGSGAAHATAGDGAELVGRMQPMTRPGHGAEASRCWSSASSASGGELGAALGAAAVEDGAAGAGAHAGAEAVLLGATTVVRLERALAHGSPRSWARTCPSRWSVVCCTDGMPGRTRR